MRSICVNALGGCFGSTGPASINPETSREYRLDFPDLSIEDIVDAAAIVLHVLGGEQLPVWSMPRWGEG
ncbi:MAG: hypothetical protein QNJ43_07540 [Breoghania sp.]|nr:hypothetical protein [Breoghania sp.]